MARCAAAVAAVAPAGCSGSLDPVDDWGPPAGYAAVAGRVTRGLDERPAAGVEVRLSPCAAPLGGLNGAAVTDTAGRYRLDAALPPRAALAADPDTLRVACVAVARDPRTGLFARRDSLVVRFRTAASGPALQTLDLGLP